MRFMMLMIPKGYETAPVDALPSAEAIAAMTHYNHEMQAAGILLSLEGLKPPAAGVRVTFDTGRPVVTDGPFAETKEALGGFWMIEVASKAEAVAWAVRCPAGPNEILELRQVMGMEDFPAEVQAAVAAADQGAND